MTTYIKLPDGEPTTNLQSLLPDTIFPENVPVAEREARGVYECVITQPTIGPLQQRGNRIIDTDARPVTITWAVEPRPNPEIWRIQADNRKRRAAERALREIGTDAETLQRKLDAVRYLSGVEV